MTCPPGPVGSMLGIRAGDQLDINIEAGSFVLTTQKKAHPKAQIIVDPVTGYSQSALDRK
jgi:hypothetical protein